MTGGELDADWPTAGALAELGEARIPTGPVLSPQQCLDHPQVGALGLFTAMPYPGLTRPAPIAALPVRLSKVPSPEARRPPTLGEHTSEILSELGYETGEIEDLRRRRVV